MKFNVVVEKKIVVIIIKKMEEKSHLCTRDHIRVYARTRQTTIKNEHTHTDTDTQ